MDQSCFRTWAPTWAQRRDLPSSGLHSLIGNSAAHAYRVDLEEGPPIWGSSGREFKSRQPDRTIHSIRPSSEGLYGRRKMTHYLRRQGLPVAFCGPRPGDWPVSRPGRCARRAGSPARAELDRPTRPRGRGRRRDRRDRPRHRLGLGRRSPRGPWLAAGSGVRTGDVVHGSLSGQLRNVAEDSLTWSISWCRVTASWKSLTSLVPFARSRA